MIAAIRRHVARVHSPAERLADRIVHLVGLAAALAGVATLIPLAAVYSGPAAVVTVAAYSLGLIAMLSFSTAYNMSGEDHRRKGLLRRFDHAAIFAMIAGTYTPFTILGLDGVWAIGMTAAVWAIAALGIAIKLLTPAERFPVASTLLYLAFGWVGLIAIGPFLEALSTPVLILLGIGGALYSVGTVFHGLQQMPFQRAIWHGFVVAAAAVHFTAVLDFAALSG